MKLLWLDINASYSHSSLALPALEAQLDNNLRDAVEWKIVSGTIKSVRDEVIEEVVDACADFIFATGWLFNIDYLLSVLRRVAAISPNVKIVLGGPEFLGDNREFLQANRFVTSVFKGEAEEVFPDFIRIIANDIESNEWLSLPGFEYVGRDGEECGYIAKECVKTKNFNALNAPEDSSFFNWNKAFVQVETSRGCFNSCRFCVSGIGGSDVEDLPVEKIRGRLRNITEKGIKEVRILDRTFNANSTRAVELISLFEEFYGKLKFHLEVHPTMLSPMLKEKLRSVPQGLLHVEAGIQSLNEEVLCNCTRKGSSAGAVAGLEYLLDIGKFEVHTDFIAGLPGYSYKNLVEDICRMMEIYPHEIQLELLKLLPGTYFRSHAQELGIAYSPEPPYEVLKTPSIEFAQLRKCSVLSKIIEYWYNDASWREIFSRMAVAEKEFLYTITDYFSEKAFMEHTYSFEGKSMLLYTFCKENYPEYLMEVSLGWIANGLSIKKEPASELKMWHYGDSDVKNPLLDENNSYKTYHYIDYENVRHWFAYDKSADRHKPIAHYKEKTDIS